MSKGNAAKCSHRLIYPLFLQKLLIMLNELYNWFRLWIFYKKQSAKMSLAIKLADIKQRAFNRQYHIMLLATPKGDRLVSVCRSDIEHLKRRKWLPKNISIFELTHSDSVFYSTPLNRNNRSSHEERMSAKAKYLSYSRNTFANSV